MFGERTRLLGGDDLFDRIVAAAAACPGSGAFGNRLERGVSGAHALTNGSVAYRTAVADEHFGDSVRNNDLIEKDFQYQFQLEAADAGAES
jgi:hypothetical protein